MRAACHRSQSRFEAAGWALQTDEPQAEENAQAAPAGAGSGAAAASTGPEGSSKSSSGWSSSAWGGSKEKGKEKEKEQEKHDAEHKGGGSDKCAALDVSVTGLFVCMSVKLRAIVPHALR